MREVTIGNARYRVIAEEREGQWVAHAVRFGSGERFGVECGAATENDALDRIGRWLTWQAEHTAALEALQRAEQAYHRTIAGSAFASGTEGPSPVELQKESLDEVEAARTRLDDIRARKPEC